MMPRIEATAHAAGEDPAQNTPTNVTRRRPTASGALIFWAVGAALLLGIWGARVAVQPLLLTFMAVLFGTALRGLAELVASKAGWSARWALAGTIALLTLIGIGAALWIVPHLVTEASALVDQAREAYSRVRESLPESALGRRVLDESEKLGRELGGVLAHTAGLLASAGGALGALLFVTFTALYLATSPQIYVRGLTRLVPRARREQAASILGMLAMTLRRWLLGRLISMTAVGVVTALGLWILGIPLAVTLGLLSGVLGFVPNIGPIVSAVPALLIALTQRPLDALLVAALYVGVNFLDGYLLTPFLQRRATSVPPALVLLSQLLMGAFWGVLGVVLATPICACLIVLVRELYVKDTLEER